MGTCTLAENWIEFVSARRIAKRHLRFGSGVRPGGRGNFAAANGADPGS